MKTFKVDFLLFLMFYNTSTVLQVYNIFKIRAHIQFLLVCASLYKSISLFLKYLKIAALETIVMEGW